MRAHHVLDEEAIAQKPRQQHVLRHDAGVIQAGFGAKSPTQDVEPLDEVIGPEVLKAGLLDGGFHQGFGFECERGTGLGHHRQDGGHVIAEPRLGQVVYDHRRRSTGRAHLAARSVVTSTVG